MKTHTVQAASLPIAPTLFGATRDSKLLLVLVAIALLTLSAKVQIPLWPVPITMQTYVVVVIAMSYGWRLGLVAVSSYLVLGALGLPVFASTPEKGTGLPYFLGPTGGYLAGFIVATAICGWLAVRGWDRSLGRCILATLVGHGMIFACGVGWLAMSVGSERAISLGFTPFIWGTALKTALAAITLSNGARWAKRNGAAAN